MKHKKSGGSHPHNLRTKSHEQDAPKAHAQPEGRRGRNKRRGSAAPESMRQSGMAR
jgi:hypothetical protein